MPSNSWDRAAPNSFSRLDATRPVNTPRSVLACELEGVLPEELVAGMKSPTKRRSTGESIADLKHSMECEFVERERQKLVAQVHKRWSSLGSSRGGSARSTREPAPPAPIHAQKVNAQTNASPTSPRPKRMMGFDPDIAQEVVRAVESDVTVAQHYLRLKAFSDAAVSARKKLDEQEAKANERYEAVKEQRHRDADERSARFNLKLEKVTAAKQEQNEERRARHEERLRRLQERLEAADQDAEATRREKATKAVAHGDNGEREAAEAARKEKLLALEEKLRAASEATKQRREERLKNEQLNQFRLELKQRALEESRARAARAKKYMQAQLREQELQERRAEEAKEEAEERQAKIRHAVREQLAKQREEISAMFADRELRGAATQSLEPPPWLLGRVEKVENEQHVRSPRKPTGSPPSNTASGRSAGGDARRAKKKPKHSESLPVMSKFTVSSPRISEQQMFAKWMYD